MGFEHQIELADAGEILLSADGADDIVFLDVFFQLRIAPAVAGLSAAGEVLDQLIGAEARLAGLAVHQRIVESAHMAGGHPHFAVHQDGTVQACVIRALLHKLLPPCLLDVVLEFHAQRAVVPGVGQAAVDLRTRKDVSAVLAQRHQLVHGQFCHLNLLLAQFPKKINPSRPNLLWDERFSLPRFHPSWQGQCPARLHC